MEICVCVIILIMFVKLSDISLIIKPLNNLIHMIFTVFSYGMRSYKKISNLWLDVHHDKAVQIVTKLYLIIIITALTGLVSYTLQFGAWGPTGQTGLILGYPISDYTMITINRLSVPIVGIMTLIWVRSVIAVNRRLQTRAYFYRQGQKQFKKK